MSIADEALAARRVDDLARAQALFKKAFELERRAAAQATAEPSPSILLRSAAWQANNAGKFADAEQAVLQGLDGSPPADVEHELRKILEQIRRQRSSELHDMDAT